MRQGFMQGSVSILWITTRVLLYASKIDKTLGVEFAPPHPLAGGVGGLRRNDWNANGVGVEFYHFQHRQENP